ncbi:MAG: zinc-ribbon domain-containing protein [Candidatus Heimdallarchaeota archaeon]|nr:zinc-ribbon domain-containing protein [Candidatus Heimdallarchaeota archaeon]
MSSEGSSLIKTLRCSTCGAPLTPSAESILTICNFCGAVTAKSPVKPHSIVKPLSLQKLPPGVGTLRKMELILIPFFQVAANVNVDASGYQRRERTETKTVRRGGKTYTETKTIVEYRPWRIHHSGLHAVRFLARQEVTLFGANEFIASVAKRLGAEAIPFDGEFIKKLAEQTNKELVALSPEWGQKEAANKAGEMVYEAAYAQAKKEMHEVFDTKVRFKPVRKPALIHVPLLLVRRVFQGRSYRAAYHWGNGQLLREERPIRNRKLMVFFAFLLFIAAPIFSQLAANNSGSWVFLAIFGVLALGSLVAGILLMVRTYQPHKIKSSGEGIDFRDFQTLPPEAFAQPTKPSETGKVEKKKSFCTQCGDPLEPGQKFCEKCGHRVS